MKRNRTAGLALAAALAVLPAATASAGAPAASALSVQPEPILPRLLVPRERMVVGYTVETAGVVKPTGALYVRDDLHARYERLALKLGTSTSNGRHPRLSAVLPARLARGHRIFLYAVISDPRSGARATLPAGGAAAPVSSWILRRPVVVRLGTHAYGRTRPADAIVARASAKQVGWDLGASPAIGPQTFLVARDRSIWLEDEVASRMLVWRPGSPASPARTVPLPPGAFGDVAFGPAGSLYVTRWHQPGFVLQLFRLTPSGRVLWQSTVGPGGPDTGVPANSLLWVGPDGALYCRVSGAGLGWPARETAQYGLLPVATAAGKPIPPAQQLRRALWGYDPAPKGARLVVDVAPNQTQLRELRLALVDRRGTVTRAWRVVSRSWFSPAPPQLVNGRPLVDLTFGRPGQVEHVVLHLSASGTSARFSLPLSIWGDYTLPDVRTGPGALVYRLSTSHTSGVVVGRYTPKDAGNP